MRRSSPRRWQERILPTTDSVQVQFAPLVPVAGRTRAPRAQQARNRARAICIQAAGRLDLQIGYTSNILVVTVLRLVPAAATTTAAAAATTAAAAATTAAAAAAIATAPGVTAAPKSGANAVSAASRPPSGRILGLARAAQHDALRGMV